MADGCDDPRQIDELARLVERGVVVAAASPLHAGRPAGRRPVAQAHAVPAGRADRCYWFARVGTRDATNSFKAYDREFVREVGIEADDGFEIGIELVAKARRLRLPVAEIPTIWLDRRPGVVELQDRASGCRAYLHWYRYAFGRGSTSSRSPAATQPTHDPERTEQP